MGIPQDWRTLIVLVSGAIIVVAAMAMLIAKLTDDVLGAEGITKLDPHATAWMLDHRTPTRTTIARAVTRLANPGGVIAVVLASITAFTLMRHVRLGVFMVLSTVGAALVTATAKLVVGRERPPSTIWLVEATGASFPSGHATQGVACWVALSSTIVLLVKGRALRVTITFAGAALAGAIGVSRIYLGVHWMSDVVCGWAVASLWLVTLLLIGWAGPRIWNEGR